MPFQCAGGPYGNHTPTSNQETIGNHEQRQQVPHLMDSPALKGINEENIDGKLKGDML